MVPKIFGSDKLAEKSAPKYSLMDPKTFCPTNLDQRMSQTAFEVETNLGLPSTKMCWKFLGTRWSPKLGLHVPAINQPSLDQIRFKVVELLQI